MSACERPSGEKKSRDAAFLESRGWKIIFTFPPKGMFRRVWWQKVGTDYKMPQYQAIEYEKMIQPRKGSIAKVREEE